MKITENKSVDLALIDTFDVIGNNQISDFIDDLGLDSILLANKGNYEVVFKRPKQYIMNHEKASSLFLASLLESSFMDNIEIRNIIKSKLN